MKTILIASDFSKASDHAALYGIEFAKAFDARVILFHAYQVPPPSIEGSIIIPPEEIRDQAQKYLDDQARVVNLAFDLNVETYCEEGYPVSAILKAAKDRKAELIITGMKESGKGFRKLFGSTVTTLAAVTSLPLIAVPQPARYTQPLNIALATESDINAEANKHLLDALREVVKKFRSEIYLVRVARSRLKREYESLNYPLKLSEMIEPLEPSYKSIEGKPVSRALNKFIEDYDINMLVMLPHQHSFFERLLVKSSTRSMIFASHIPVLILPEIRQEENKKIETHEVMNGTTKTVN
jgi:nucleotide-binding universal stress UspA family protein